MFAPGTERGARSDAPCDGGIDAVTAQRDVVAVAVGVLEECGDTVGQRGRDGGTEVEGSAILARRAKGESELTSGGAVGLFANAVDEAAGATAAEDQRVGAFQNFDTVDGIEVAEIGDIVADTIDEEVGSGGIAAQDGRIAVALTLGDPGAGHVARDVADAVHGLIVDEFAGDDADGLGDIDEGGVGLGGRDAALAGVGFFALVVYPKFLEMDGVVPGRKITGGRRGLGKDGRSGEAERQHQQGEHVSQGGQVSLHVEKEKRQASRSPDAPSGRRKRTEVGNGAGSPRRAKLGRNLSAAKC